MSMYREGYEHYLEKCEQFGIEPVNFHFYVMQLSQEQLVSFAEQARTVRAGN
ncbi:transcriptional regulator [Bacillus ndiopicus]|uniref:transcriptional regulator n=1 Tax=Bacillus ndiopicus TaxID=1347368 RepID=UPI0005A94627|nr:transcriptional regulator [Bacillus ndiopicus]